MSAPESSVPAREAEPCVGSDTETPTLAPTTDVTQKDPDVAKPEPQDDEGYSTDGSFSCGERSDEEEPDDDDKAFIVDDDEDEEEEPEPETETETESPTPLAGAGGPALPATLARDDDAVQPADVRVVDNADHEDEASARLAHALGKLEGMTHPYLHKIAKNIMEIQPYDWELTGERTKAGNPKKRQVKWDQERLLDVITKALMDPDTPNHDILMNHLTHSWRPARAAPDLTFKESGAALTMASIITTADGSRPRRGAARRALTSLQAHVSADPEEWELPIDGAPSKEGKDDDDDDDDDTDEEPVRKRARAARPVREGGAGHGASGGASPPIVRTETGDAAQVGEEDFVPSSDPESEDDEYSDEDEDDEYSDEDDDDEDEDDE